MGGSSMARIARQSSIESEPRTLKIQQIQIAREAALCVLNTRSTEEALSIFTEGLEPVASHVQGQYVDRFKELIDSDHETEEDSRPADRGLKLPAGLRNVATAPF